MGAIFSSSGSLGDTAVEKLFNDRLNIDNFIIQRTIGTFGCYEIYYIAAGGDLLYYFISPAF